MDMNILYGGILQHKDVELTNDYEQFIINRILSEIDNGIYAEKINKLSLMNLTDKTHYALVRSIIPVKFHKMVQTSVFKYKPMIKTASEYAELLELDKSEFIKEWLEMTPQEQKQITNYIEK